MNLSNMINVRKMQLVSISSARSLLFNLNSKLKTTLRYKPKKDTNRIEELFWSFVILSKNWVDVYLLWHNVSVNIFAVGCEPLV